MKNDPKDYEIKKQRFIDTCRFDEPDRIPIQAKVANFAMGYNGKTAKECYEDPQAERESWAKVYNDVYYDGISGLGMNFPFKAYLDLETETYFISRNQVTLQHHESAHMTVDEYDEFINDPITYIANKAAYRKLGVLRKPYPESYQILKGAFIEMDEYKKRSAANKKYAEDILGLPVVTSGTMSHVCDMFFDFVRGFTPTLGDMRRCPDNVLKAIEALIPYYENSIPKKDKAEFPFIYNTCHIPTFLSKEFFGKFFWPYYQRMITQAYESGTRTMSFCEGKWEQHFDYLNELPKGALIALLESDDIIKAKKLIGDKVILAGGMPLSLLKYGTIEECKEHAKKVIDACAPGGGFIFTTDKSLLDVNDIKAENLIALNDFVHEYGKR